MNKNMTYDEAIAYSITVPWQVTPCDHGEKCWCRIIEPVKRITYGEGDIEELYIAASGCIPTVYAQYLVNLHNSHLSINNANGNHNSLRND
jgi:hypothetical protein